MGELSFRACTVCKTEVNTDDSYVAFVNIYKTTTYCHNECYKVSLEETIKKSVDFFEQQGLFKKVDGEKLSLNYPCGCRYYFSDTHRLDLEERLLCDKHKEALERLFSQDDKPL